MMDEREIELLVHKKLSHIPDISNRDIYCFKEGYATAEQRIADVIAELGAMQEDAKKNHSLVTGGIFALGSRLDEMRDPRSQRQHQEREPE